MKKLISILITLALPVFVIAQVSKYQGKYHAISLSILGGEKMKSDFEVGADGIINGNFTVGENEETVMQGLAGKTNAKGKFEAQVTNADGIIFSISGSLPIDKEKGMISFLKREILSGSGSKNVSESGSSGFIIRLSDEESAPEITLEDTGKTQLIFGNTTILFPNDWWPDTTIYSVTNNQNNTFKTIEISDTTADSKRYFRFALAEQPGKKTWLADEGFAVSYREKAGIEMNNFLYKKSGKIELISENDHEIVFKISNLQLKKLAGENVVRIDGFIYAIKTQ